MKHGWKVGETYKSLAGDSYKLVAIIPEAAEDQQLVFLRCDNDRLGFRYIDGKLRAACGPEALDILPPKKYVYVNIFYSYSSGVSARGWATEQEALRNRTGLSGFVRMEKIEI